jgi:hypothetical protein
MCWDVQALHVDTNVAIAYSVDTLTDCGPGTPPGVSQAAESDPGSVIASVVWVAVIPGKTKYMITAQGQAPAFTSVGPDPEEALLPGVRRCKHTYTLVNMDGSRAIIWIPSMV